MEQAKLGDRALVSVVTPFYNTAPYLAECIESVLAQSYTDFEYLLVDNCSTDGSNEIAATYARQDPRIRLIRRPHVLPQLRNYNDALTRISDASEYCKIVQADDYIFPQCLELMVRAFEQSEAIGLVSSYWLENALENVKGLSMLYGSGYPYPLPKLSGKECARLYLRTGIYVFGSETTVMYRSTLMRECPSFYDESLPGWADFERCMQILRHWDFGFVHQLLSFTRRDNESLISSRLPFRPFDLDRYLGVQRHAATFLEPREATSVRRKAKQAYYRVLANEALRFRERAFWRYHLDGLKTADETIDWPYLALQIAKTLLWLGLNPGMTMMSLVRAWKRRSGATAYPESDDLAGPVGPSPEPATQDRSSS
jgi:glycosyltransferase involved in cell wall biosynthesis